MMKSFGGLCGIFLLPAVLATSYKDYLKDYSCYHWYSWQLNKNDNYSSAFASYTEIISSEYISSRRKLQEYETNRQLHDHSTNLGTEVKVESTMLTTGWKVSFTGIPRYTRNISSWDMNLITSRPNYSKDFVGGTTKATLGTTYDFGDDIGYGSKQCTLGFWPSGPDCPEYLDGKYVFPIEPAPESSSSKCFPKYLFYAISI